MTGGERDTAERLIVGMSEAMATARAEARNQALEEAIAVLASHGKGRRAALASAAASRDDVEVSAQTAAVNALSLAESAIRALIAPAGEG